MELINLGETYLVPVTHMLVDWVIIGLGMACHMFEGRP